MTARERYAAERDAEWLSDKRLVRFARRQVNADLRKWRQAKRDGSLDASYLIADCKAKIELLNWVDRWSCVREPDYHNSDSLIRAEMQSNYILVVASVRYLAQAWKDREGWRPEWEHL